MPTSTSASRAPSTTVAGGPPEPAAGIAARLTAVEGAIADPATPASQLPSLGESQQDLEAALVEDPALFASVSARLPPTISSKLCSLRISS